MKVILYVPEGRCVQCDATKRGLQSRGIDYEERRAADYPDEVDRLAALNGRTAPMVVAGAQSWSGYQPDHIRGLWSPPLD